MTDSDELTGDQTDDQPPIRVLLVDDHALVRGGILRILAEEPGIEVVGEAEDGRGAVSTALELRPDVILMDLEMPGMSGIEATREIVQADAAIRVLMLTIYDQDEFLFEALEAGASGYLLKGASIDELVGAIRVVAGGEVHVAARMATKLVGDYLRRRQSGDTGDEYETLTARERELLPLLADEDTNEAIALRLGLSPLTVRTHRQRVMQKLNLHTKSELLKYALRRGLISLDE